MSDGVYLWFLLQNEITITAQQYVNLIQVAIAQGFHLFPFRTEKLSLVTPMVLRHSGRVGSCRFWLKPPDLKKFRRLFFCIHVWLRTLMPWKKAGNRTGRSEGPPNRETEDDYSAFMQAAWTEKGWCSIKGKSVRWKHWYEIWRANTLQKKR